MFHTKVIVSQYAATGIGVGDEFAKVTGKVCGHKAPDRAVAGVQVVVDGLGERGPAVGVDHLKAFEQKVFIDSRRGNA